MTNSHHFSRTRYDVLKQIIKMDFGFDNPPDDILEELHQYMVFYFSEINYLNVYVRQAACDAITNRYDHGLWFDIGDYGSIVQTSPLEAIDKMDRVLISMKEDGFS